MKKPKLARILGLWIAPLVGISALAIADFVFLHTPRQRTHTLSMTVGQYRTTRTPLAQALQDAGDSFGIKLEIRQGAGSEDTVEVETAALRFAEIVLFVTISKGDSSR